jgi:N-acyl-D-amino-acid deacylase
MFELLIRDATIVDGTGAPRFSADLAVDEGRIAAVGRLGGLAARRTINAEGRILAPGFIDLHTHVEYSLGRFPRAQSMVRQGVTLVLAGNCGFSPFPITPEHSDELRAISAFLPSQLSWEWRDAAGFMESLRPLPLATNVALLVGHGALRIAAMGLERRSPTEAELETMKKLLTDSLRSGVFGMSSGLIYAPGNFSSTGELVTLASVAAQHGGFYASHIRGEGDGLLDSVDEAIAIGRLAGASVQVSHVKAAGIRNWGRLPESLRRMEDARVCGVDVLGDQYPYTAASTSLTTFMPMWALDGGVERLLRRLANAEDRTRIHAELAAQSPEMIRSGIRAFEPQTAWIASVPDGPAKAYEGKPLTEIATGMGVDASEAVLRLLELAHASVRVILFSMDEDDVRAGLRDSSIAVGSDGETLSPDEGSRPHPRSYGAFARVLGRYVRDEQVLTLEAAVRKMTSLPARRLRLTDRGQIRPAAIADLVLFDPATVADLASFEDPHRFCTGVTHVVVNGQVVIDNAADTGVVAGRVLKRL